MNGLFRRIYFDAFSSKVRPAKGRPGNAWQGQIRRPLAEFLLEGTRRASGFCSVSSCRNRERHEPGEYG
jgi:hypothetical protein